MSVIIKNRALILICDKPARNTLYVRIGRPSPEFLRPYHLTIFGRVIFY